MSSSSGHETATSRNPSSSSSASKLVHLTKGTNGATLDVPQTSSISQGNVHCSINQQSGNGGAGLAPIMEIREMNSYCNSCITVGTEKYWNHHPHANVPRHTAVYPQMFYTPPPPHPAPSQSTNYSTASGGVMSTASAPNDWSCPPSTADSYSHFMYSQYPPPPPAPPQHHDYNNFLSISTSCYEPDMMMMSTVPGTSSQLQNSCEPSGPAQALMNSFMYPAPLPQPPQLQLFDNHPVINSTMPSSTQQQRIPVKVTKSESFSHPAAPISPTSTTTSGDSIDESDDDEESSHIISIEDDDNDKVIDDEIMSPHATEEPTLSAFCVLCKRPASLLSVLPTNAPSPQLSRILDNIDDDELDISVCSGDIEIGGIEDEMIQQATEQQQQKISLHRLCQLVGVPVSELLSGEEKPDDEQTDPDQAAILCPKCQKLVGMAESLEKQLSSVLGTLRQVCSLEDGLTAGKRIKFSPAQVNSIAVQTEDYDLTHPKDFIHVRRCNSDNGNIPCRKFQETANHMQLSLESRHATIENAHDSILVLSQYLCHECGRNFNCRRNLGKHLKRYHHHFSQKDKKSKKLPTCPRENCGRTFFDKTALQIHLRTHTSEKPFFCVTCLMLFTTKSNLTAHIKSNICQERGESNNEQFPVVTSTTSTLSQKPGDVKGCSGSSPPFHCENCGLTFRTESRFQKHANNKAICNKSKLLHCDICSKHFAKRSELQAHQVVHTRAKSFQCDICGMAFSTRGNQRVHQRTHFNQKRFKCQQCDKAFTRNQTLQIHIANVH